MKNQSTVLATILTIGFLTSSSVGVATTDFRFIDLHSKSGLLFNSADKKTKSKTTKLVTDGRSNNPRAEN
jgi:hypothetical protein